MNQEKVKVLIQWMRKKQEEIKLLTRYNTNLKGYPFRSGKTVWLQISIKFNNETNAKQFAKEIYESADKISVLNNLLNRGENLE